MDMEGSAVAEAYSREIPSTPELKLQMSDEKFEEMLQVRDRERRDELERIGSLGMVDRMKDELDRRLGRNLAMKQRRGPLEQRSRKLSKSHSLKRRKLKRGGPKKWNKSVVGHEALEEAEERGRHGDSASHYKKIMTDQHDELKSIRDLNLVAKSSTREAISHHIAGHAARLSNHRLTILPSSSASSGRRRDRKKSSVLVTSVEEDEDIVREMHRQQSRVFIESIIQCPSRQQRVLEKLSTEQMQMIKDVEEMKWKRKRSSRGSSEELEDSKIFHHPLPQDQNPFDFPPPPSAPKHTHPSDIDNYEKHKKTTQSPNSAFEDVNESLQETQSGRVVPDGDDYEEKESSEEDTDGGADLDHISSIAQGATFISSEDSLLPNGINKEGVGGSENTSASFPTFSSQATSQVQETKVAMFSSYTKQEDSIFAESSGTGGISEYPEAPTGLPATLAPENSPPIASAVAASQRVTYDEVSSWVAVETLEGDDDPLSWAESSDSSVPSVDSSPMHLSHSSPQFSQNMSSVMRSLSGRTTGPVQHGTYSKVEVEINPFASEFKMGVRPEDSVNKLPHFTSANRFSCSRPGSASRKLKMSGSSILSPGLSPLDSGRTVIPNKAFHDPGFIAFMEELGKEPDVSDYVLYKMRVIGDEIEEKYSKELSQAMDEVFFEVVKHSLSWHTFKSVSKRLLVCGSRIQDSILLVPCFARRLVDVVPQMGGRIADYTEQVLDSYASDSILGMGGWNTFMESYEEFGTGEEYEMLGSAVDPVYEQPNMMSPGVAGPYATLPTRRKPLSPKLPSFDAPFPTEDISITQSLSGRQRPTPAAPLALRRCNSVEVLFPEDDHSSDMKQDASLHPPPFLQTIYSRSISVNSLDLATPSCTNPRLAVTSTLVRSDSRSSVVIGRFGLSPLPEEEVRIISRRSSVCSITLISGLSATEIEPDIVDGGFEVIGRQEDHRKDQDLEENSSSSNSRQSHTASSPARTDSTSSSASGGDPERRRRRSSADIVTPLVALATHAIAFSCYYFSS